MLAIFAFEELAKYNELKKAKTKAITDKVDKAEIDDRLFRIYEHKQELHNRQILITLWLRSDQLEY